MPISPYVFPGIKEQYRTSNSRKYFKSVISPEDVLKIISENCNVKIEDVLSKTRKKDMVEARHIFCAIMRNQFGHSYTTIGQFIGHRDHTTVIHSIKVFNNRCFCEEGYKELITNILYQIDTNIK